MASNASVFVGKTVAELKQLCQSQGLNSKGLRKAEIIQLLLDNIAEEVVHTDTHEIDDNTVHDSSKFNDDEDITDDVDCNDDENDGEDDDVLAAETSKTCKEKLPGELASLKLQVQLAKLELAKMKLATSLPTPHGTVKEMKNKIDHNVKGLLPHMSANCDCLNFFHVFERTLEMHDVSRQDWSLYLPACLNARAMKVYSRLTLDQCKDYDVVKREVLTSFRLTARAYYEKFTGATKYHDESFRLFLNRLSELQTYYFESRGLNSFEKLRDDCLLMQFIASLHPLVRQFVESRTPATPEQAAHLADLYLETQGRKDTTKRYNGVMQKKPSETQIHENKFQKPADEAAVSTEGQDVNAASSQYAVKCWTCGGNHKRIHCTQRSNHVESQNIAQKTTVYNSQRGKNSNNSVRTSKNVTSALVNDKSFGNSRFVVPAYLNGKYVTCYRDSGANLSVCRKLLIPASAYTGEFADISGVTGKQQRVALAKLWLRSPLFGSRGDALITVGCLDDLPYDLLLGNSFFELNTHLRDVIVVQSDVIDAPAQPKAADVDRAKSLNERNILSVVTRRQAAAIDANASNPVECRVERCRM
jgi:hypothetical protein